MSLWPETFLEDARPSPKEILEQQAKLLPKLTGDLVRVRVEDYLNDKPFFLRNTSFTYRFIVQPRFVENYRFIAFHIGHNITLYPALFWLNPFIGAQLHIPPLPNNGHTKTVSNSDEFEDFLGKVLKTDQIKLVVSSLMRLSK